MFIAPGAFTETQPSTLNVDGVNDIGHAQVGSESILSPAAVLRMVKKILVGDCGPPELPKGVVELVEDLQQGEIMRRLPSFDALGVRRGPSGTI